MADKKYFYYRIFDDKEEKKYFKSTFERSEILKELEAFEKDHQKYFTVEFIEFLRKKDPEAEIIEIQKIYY